MKKILFFVSVLGLLGVVLWLLLGESPATPTPEGVSTISVKLGEEASLEGESLTPLQVLEDSRCPLDTECIQAGTVRILAELSSGLGVSEQIFILGEPITTEVNSFTLAEVDPEMEQGSAVAPEDYVFTFVVEKRSADAPLQ